MKNNKIEAIVFDLAGTLIDFGSLAPSKVLIHIFNKIGIPISRKEAIGPMGIEKRAHISRLINTKKINLQWKKKYKKKPSKNDIDKLLLGILTNFHSLFIILYSFKSLYISHFVFK